MNNNINSFIIILILKAFQRNIKRKWYSNISKTEVQQNFPVIIVFSAKDVIRKFLKCLNFWKHEEPSKFLFKSLLNAMYYKI